MSAVCNEPLNKQMDVMTLRRKYESHLVHLTCDNRHERKSMISTRIVATIHASNPQELQWISYSVCDTWTSANALGSQSWCPGRKVYQTHIRYTHANDRNIKIDFHKTY